MNFRNAEDTLACLRSLEATDHSCFTVVVVDNASGDGSADAIEAYLRSSPLGAEVVRAPENLGYAGGVNTGMRRALAGGASHLAVMNNDVTVEPGFGEALAAACTAHPDAVVAGCILSARTGLPTHNLGTISPLTLRIRFLLAEYDGRPFDFVSGCLMVLPAAVVTRIGFLEERYFMYCEDLEYCLRLREAGVPLAYAPRLRIRHKVNASVDKVSLAKEYYFVRNQTHLTLTRGTTAQKAIYLACLAAVVANQIRRPRILAAFLRGIRDARAGRLGRR